MILNLHNSQEIFCMIFERYKWGSSQSWCWVSHNLAHGTSASKTLWESHQFLYFHDIEPHMVRDIHEFWCVFLSSNCHSVSPSLLAGAFVFALSHIHFSYCPSGWHVVTWSSTLGKETIAYIGCSNLF